jgi:hypothetical protein
MVAGTSCHPDDPDSAHDAPRKVPGADPRERAGRRLRLLARRFDLRPGELVELLERLPFGERFGHPLPEVWERPIARRVLETYAARKRAVARLARRGGL